MYSGSSKLHSKIGTLILSNISEYLLFKSEVKITPSACSAEILYKFSYVGLLKDFKGSPSIPSKLILLTKFQDYSH